MGELATLNFTYKECAIVRQNSNITINKVHNDIYQKIVTNIRLYINHLS